GAAQAVAPPGRAGGDGDVVEAELAHLGRAQAAVEEELHVGQLVELSDAPVAHAAVARQTRQAGEIVEMAAELGAGFRERHGITALAQGTRRLQARRTTADHEHAGVAAPWRDALGVPAAPPLLALGRV